jgi:hypothetical protein
MNAVLHFEEYDEDVFNSHLYRYPLGYYYLRFL